MTTEHLTPEERITELLRGFERHLKAKDLSPMNGAEALTVRMFAGWYFENHQSSRIAELERALWEAQQCGSFEVVKPSSETKGELPGVLFDGYGVLQALTDKARTRTSAENVSDVLDAVVQLMRAAVPTAAVEFKDIPGDFAQVVNDNFRELLSKPSLPTDGDRVAAIPNAGPLATDLLDRVLAATSLDDKSITLSVGRARWIIDALSKAENLTQPLPPSTSQFDDCEFVGNSPEPFDDWNSWAAAVPYVGVRIEARRSIAPGYRAGRRSKGKTTKSE
jgi:hypothetical protein